ncbi:MAG: hypothetical protein ACOYEU_01035 [Limnochordia bacterium]
MRIGLVLGLLLCLLGGSGVNAQYTQVVLVIWHGAELQDLAGLAPHIPQAWALMNTRTGGGAGLEGAYLSVASGARAVGVVGAGEVFEGEEDETYSRNTGLTPAALVQPEIWRVHSGQNTSYTVYPGALGTALLEAELKVAAFGNSDGDGTARWAGTIAADSFGRIPAGRVNRTLLVADPERPFGVSTDYALLLQLVRESDANLIVVDLGDPYRFDEAAAALMPAQYDRLRAQMVAEARTFITSLITQLSDSTAVFVVSPHPGRLKASQNLWLAPAVLFGQETGLLTSPTTKWPGIITNMDIAPTILSLLGVKPPPSMVGSPAAVLPMVSASALKKVEALEGQIIWLASYRGPVLRSLVGVQIGVYLAALAVMAWGMRPAVRLLRAIQLLLAAALAIPAVLLILPAGLWAALGMLVVLALVQLTTKDLLWVVAVIGLSTAVLVGIDTVTGSSLMRFSFLGYDPIGGARFYGLGNEYMGIMIGALIMGWVCLAELVRFDRGVTAAAAVPIFASALGVVAAPWWGTNVGGAITAVVGFGVTWGALRRMRFSWRSALALAAAVALVLGGLIFVDAVRLPEQQSHIGRTTRLVGLEGIAAVYDIIQRKLSMNLRLIRYSIWSRAWIAALGLIGASFIWPSRFIIWLVNKYPQIASGIWGTVAAGTAALVFNDSGVVAAATCVFFAATTMAVLALDYRKLKHDLLPPEAYVENNSDGH